jgi:hypothetical protein
MATDRPYDEQFGIVYSNSLSASKKEIAFDPKTEILTAFLTTACQFTSSGKAVFCPHNYTILYYPSISS